MTERSRLRAGITHLVAALVSLGLVACATAPAQAGSKMPSERHWRKDVAKVMKGSHAYVDRVAGDRDAAYAINFDIDNSSLATYYRKGKAIPAVLRFATYASEKYDVALLFNTARTGKPLKRARALLTKAGYPVTEVCGRKSRKVALVQGKKHCRARFIKEGYTIIANVGNRRTDFAGPKNYGRAFKLPDYHGRLG